MLQRCLPPRKKFCATDCTKFVALVIAASLSSCAHVMVEDRTMSPLVAGVGRAETVLCGNRAVGDNVCWIRDGESAVLEVAGPFSGYVTVKSDACGIDVRQSYQSFEPVKISVPYNGSGGRFCVLDVFVMPSYPVDSGDVVVVGLTGRAVVGFLSATSVPARMHSDLAQSLVDGGLSLSVPAGSSMPGKMAWSLMFNQGFSGIVRLEGCGVEPIELAVSDRAEAVPVPFSRLAVLMSEKSHCVLYGLAVDLKRPVDYAMMIAVEVHDIGYVPLAEPVVVFSDKRIGWFSPDPISFSVVGQESNAGGSGRARVTSWPVWLRQYTANGRSFVGRYDDGLLSWGR